jgi:hypothetical protein
MSCLYFRHDALLLGERLRPVWAQCEGLAERF